MDTCDACGGSSRALVWWWLDTYDLDRRLCGSHSDTKSDAMLNAGWCLMEDERVDAIHPRLAPVSADPATH